MLSGIGGQGVQLAAQVLARAAIREGRHVVLLGTYGGTMRGGSTDSTLVVGDAPILAPPLVSRTWSALAMHHEFWEPVRRKLRAGSVVACNASLFEGEVDRSRHRVFDVEATRMADDLGSPLAASLVLVAAFARATGLVGIDALVAGMHEALPPYRRVHAEGNERALLAGFDALPAQVAPAWPAEGEAA